MELLLKILLYKLTLNLYFIKLSKKKFKFLPKFLKKIFKNILKKKLIIKQKKLLTYLKLNNNLLKKIIILKKQGKQDLNPQRQFWRL